MDSYTRYRKKEKGLKKVIKNFSAEFFGSLGTGISSIYLNFEPKELFYKRVGVERNIKKLGLNAFMTGNKVYINLDVIKTFNCRRASEYGAKLSKIASERTSA